MNALKFVGSSDLLGNPTGFVNTLGSGAKSFYQHPKDGFMKGPLQGIKGTASGMATMGEAGLAATAGSLGKIVGSLNKGLLALSTD
eukprot:CAMPEP_0176343502 /NCGR_PEP_ID=MMETSP0126-20121128/3992_1 /TAXON_ID=141414 ORGANISM="Strombidinopsis acuminatum, Strain SPMC142" /NCGR_SAMPLE_ID=MMETSP0126 /ASSEMBLY_ACC=CAM_ASM_000229 /LENGTH=85 /DNA_ID=CAMNT_0017689483 /DNA_START=5062 /DNA_END=5319 /DNA_ORIENTATION=+